MRRVLFTSAACLLFPVALARGAGAGEADSDCLRDRQSARGEISFGEPHLALLVRELAAGSPSIAAVIEAWKGERGGGGLTLRRGEAGTDRNGQPSRAAFHARFEAVYEEVVGERTTLPSHRRPARARICRAEIVIDDSVPPGSPVEELHILHELGHAASAIADPVRYLELGSDEREVDTACQPLAPSDRPLEQEADGFLRRAVAELGKERELYTTWFPFGLRATAGSASPTPGP